MSMWWKTKNCKQSGSTESTGTTNKTVYSKLFKELSYSSIEKEEIVASTKRRVYFLDPSRWLGAAADLAISSGKYSGIIASIFVQSWEKIYEILFQWSFWAIAPCFWLGQKLEGSSTKVEEVKIQQQLCVMFSISLQMLLFRSLHSMCYQLVALINAFRTCFSMKRIEKSIGPYCDHKSLPHRWWKCLEVIVVQKADSFRFWLTSKSFEIFLRKTSCIDAWSYDYLWWVQSIEDKSDWRAKKHRSG